MELCSPTSGVLARKSPLDFNLVAIHTLVSRPDVVSAENLPPQSGVRMVQLTAVFGTVLHCELIPQPVASRCAEAVDEGPCGYANSGCP
jgi:hypothetical protein